MADNVLVDAQYTLATVMRPFDNFEPVYQDQSSQRPIAFYAPDADGKRPALDPDAGRAGFAPNLLRYVPVPLGAKVLVWVPNTPAPGPGFEVLVPYTYTVYWRLRTVTDYRNRRSPYHLSQQFPGQVDTSVTPSEPRFVLPAATRTVILHQPESIGTAAQINHLRREELEFGIASANAGFLPFLPDGSNGIHQQGVTDPAIFSTPEQAGVAFFAPFVFDAQGDEMLIVATRSTEFGANWNFNSSDAGFSNVYGINARGPTHPPIPDLGIYVMTGSSP
jgi:hypothetical protein